MQICKISAEHSIDIVSVVNFKTTAIFIRANLLNSGVQHCK